MIDKIRFDGIGEKALGALKKATYSNLLKVAIDNSDGVIIASKEIPNDLQEYINTLKKPVLSYIEKDQFEEPYLQFYKTILP
jgi:starch synthase